jgi:hypothetical protein
VIPRPSLALLKALLVEYHNNDGQFNYCRLMASLLRHLCWDKMMFDCKSHCHHCIVCNRSKPDRRGNVALQPLGIPENPWKIVGIDYINDIPKSGTYGYKSVFIMVYHLQKKERNPLLRG